MSPLLRCLHSAEVLADPGLGIMSQDYEAIIDATHTENRHGSDDHRRCLPGSRARDGHACMRGLLFTTSP